jgi:hypothetical protein
VEHWSDGGPYLTQYPKDSKRSNLRSARYLNIAAVADSFHFFRR